MQTTYIDPASARWSNAVERMRHDVYHLPGYAAFAATHQEPGEPAAFLAEEGEELFLVPLIVRPIEELEGAPGGLRDAVSPRGYAGPIVTSGAAGEGREFAVRAVDAFRATLRDRGIVSAFVRLHPLFGLGAEPARSGGTVVDHGESVSIDLSLGDVELWRQTRGDHRRAITRARRLGFEPAIDDRWEAFEAFLDVYWQSMERVGADPFWQLSREYFEGLRAALGRHLRLCVVRDRDTVAAAALITEVDGLVEYHLAGTADAYVRASPSKLVVDFVRSWAKRRGNRVFHLGGSVRAGDSLSQFKASFSPLRHAVRTWRVVADEAAYRALVGAWERRHGLAADAVEGFFPAYRRSPADEGG